MAETFHQFSTEDMMTLASSPAGQQLITLLQQTGGGSLRQAMEKAAAGNMAEARDLLTPLLSDTRIRALLGRLGEP